MSVTDSPEASILRQTHFRAHCRQLRSVSRQLSALAAEDGVHRDLHKLGKPRQQGPGDGNGLGDGLPCICILRGLRTECHPFGFVICPRPPGNGASHEQVQSFGHCLHARRDRLTRAAHRLGLRIDTRFSAWPLQLTQR
ncbi:hypothetical protein [Frigidibacter mobilis]|uniref:hypothetical protein n=1 Tax=Frigidibacter mobilis TaxID=1335048 RepID=UPI00141233DD|nr:hypothetical protein [Frigidibacter mobilis]